MTANTSISLFCQWLLTEPDKGKTACTIVLHGDPDIANDSLIQQITEYLNEYDGDADGLWFNATAELIQKIADTPSHKKLIGISNAKAGSANDLTQILLALNNRGHLVCLAPSDPNIAAKLKNAFHAGVTSGNNTQNSCHLTLNPKLIARGCLSQIIADVFLEWMSSFDRLNPPIRTIQ